MRGLGKIIPGQTHRRVATADIFVIVLATDDGMSTGNSGRRVERDRRVVELRLSGGGLLTQERDFDAGAEPLEREEPVGRRDF